MMAVGSAVQQTCDAQESISFQCMHLNTRHDQQTHARQFRVVRTQLNAANFSAAQTDVQRLHSAKRSRYSTQHSCGSCLQTGISTVVILQLPAHACHVHEAVRVLRNKCYFCLVLGSAPLSILATQVKQTTNSSASGTKYLFEVINLGKDTHHDFATARFVKLPSSSLDFEFLNSNSSSASPSLPISQSLALSLSRSRSLSLSPRSLSPPLSLSLSVFAVSFVALSAHSVSCLHFWLKENLEP